MKKKTKVRPVLGEAKIPDEYRPFKELVICSNSFINGVIPIMLDNHIPLLVGNDNLPIVWLSMRNMKGIWNYVIERNVSLRNKFFVEINDKIKRIIIKLKIENIIKDKIEAKYTLPPEERTILSIEKISQDRAIINEFDFRPLGMIIYGDKEGLNVGNTVLSNNSFENVHTMIKIGGSGKSP